MLNKLIRNIMFRLRYIQTPPWDTGISPPELEAFIANHPAGRAIDLGCGTGTNVMRLAQAGWEVKGVDFVPKAIQIAKQKIKIIQESALFEVGDVSDKKIYNGPYDLVLDMGCYHALTLDQQNRYRKQVSNHLAKDGQFMLYAFINDGSGGLPGLSPSSLKDLLEDFILEKREDGVQENGPSSAWFWYKKL